MTFSENFIYCFHSICCTLYYPFVQIMESSFSGGNESRFLNVRSWLCSQSGTYNNFQSFIHTMTTYHNSMQKKWKFKTDVFLSIFKYWYFELKLSFENNYGHFLISDQIDFENVDYVLVLWKALKNIVMWKYLLRNLIPIRNIQWGGKIV